MSATAAVDADVRRPAGEEVEEECRGGGVTGAK
jgi:hypothetical protein